MRNTTKSIAVVTATVLASITMGNPEASALAGQCLYPPSKAALSVGLSTTAPVAGQPVYVRGRLSYNKCGAAGSTVTVRSGGKTIGSRTTNATGDYAVRFTPNVRTSVYAASTFTRAPLKSRTIAVAVRTNLRSTGASVAPACKVVVKGSILPVRKGLAISIQRRITKGKKFVGWQTLATARTSAKGRYGATVSLPCGSKVGLSTYIPPTKTNAANRSTTLSVTPKK